MTNEGLADMLQQFFAGVDYTAPTFYFGLGINYDFDAVACAASTAARMTAGAPSYPATNDFQDVGSRQALDWSAGAVVVGGLVNKTTPPVSNFTALIVTSSGYSDVTYIITAPGLGPAVPPAVLTALHTITSLPDPPPAPGDFLAVTYGFILTPQ